MAFWNYDSAQTLFKFAGGSPSRAPMMSAVAGAESSYDDKIVSPAGAIGLWQIMPFWAGDLGWPVSFLYQPIYNAKAAVHISGGGFHVGAWDTCYNPPSAAANRLDLRWPEKFSPAWNILQSHGASVAPRGSGVGAGTPSPGDRELVRQAEWANHLQNVAIQNNTAWVAYNRKLHKLRSSHPQPI